MAKLACIMQKLLKISLVCSWLFGLLKVHLGTLFPPSITEALEEEGWVVKLLCLPSLQAWLFPGFFFLALNKSQNLPIFQVVKPPLSRCCAGTKVVIWIQKFIAESDASVRGGSKSHQGLLTWNVCGIGAAGDAGLGASLEKPLETWLLFQRPEELQWWNHELFQIAHDLAPTFHVSICSFLEEQKLSPLLSWLMGLWISLTCKFAWAGRSRAVRGIWTPGEALQLFK